MVSEEQTDDILDDILRFIVTANEEGCRRDIFKTQDLQLSQVADDYYRAWDSATRSTRSGTQKRRDEPPS